MIKIPLDGEWTLENRSGKPEYQTPAIVPGCVHTDLLEAGLIPDPYYRDNEQRLMWIGEHDWSYRRSFQLEASELDCKSLLLCCEGLDTFAQVILNGISIAHTDNMFRSWQWDVKEHLKAGTNEIEVLFRSPLPYGREQQEQHFLIHTGIGHHRLEGGNWVRKEACNYGWDWGPMLLTAGIWKPIYLLALESSRLESIMIEPTVFADDSAALRLNIHTPPCPLEPHHLDVEISFEGERIDSTSVKWDDSGETEITLTFDHVQRWWPTGMGEQPLYNVTIQLRNSRGKTVDAAHRRIGFRDLSLVTEFDEWGQSFKFRANGVDFFAKGANWIPADTFTSRIHNEHVRDLLESAVEANMNCMRVWGGGLYESDTFYDLCDELGICIWQDFMFACSAYPLHDREFLENVEVEAVQNVKRLHHHASLFLWCGNNELEHMDGYIGDTPGAMPWHHYSQLFDVRLREIVRRHHPNACYWPASEHSPIGNRTPRIHSSDPRWGDAHLWKVWHGREPFEWYRGSFHRFCSEFGFQAFPHPSTLEEILEQEDRSITSYVMELHQRSPGGNSTIMAYMLDWFRLPVGFENTIWLSQILQALGIKYAVEHWRRNMPRCMGATYWQLNDCWPVASWSSIDSSRRWKALHYEAKRFFAPQMLSIIEDAAQRQLEIHITQDDAAHPSANLLVSTWHTRTGVCLDQQSFEISEPTRGSCLAAHCEIQIDPELASERDVVMQVEWKRDQMVMAENMATWVRPKHLNLGKPMIESSVGCDDEGRIYVDLCTDVPALWAWLDAKSLPDLRWSDNFFHLYPERKRRIYLHNPGITTLEGLAEQLRVRSLWNTYQD
ncbi:MAG: glycoside hydrolase family 2 protein [Puniceicoccaceae bacterium]